ncbi:hypothetical protein [Klebsiella pneumoniae]|uniref:hypothetical protein n=1 Tax=Klebsiella pneumoniae TaxID=573 RepID=UPI000B6D8515|nr:hypothetical protein [Klebsiella pneumoniae]MCS5949236.1 hypothetical protein [Klebsiella pneumoniae subsp. pneumoniae]MCB3638825.1 hypothetical protein [Klebsiella pneumoniae]MCS6334864.1 hypothetical protein [Klebsiella pneumoniae]MEA4576721.1 hypothetical protein [Klebsiella pneumoniae]OUG77973.1 hypothetical protein AZZ97_005498 [Klebsiella pneumoniae]
MKTFKDMTPMQRIAALRKTGVNLFPNLSKEEKRAVLYIENEPAISAQRKELKLATY